MNKKDKELESIKIFAVTEALILWDEIANKGYINKHGAIERLYQRKKLLRRFYHCGCPLCHYFDMDCSICPWPEITGRTVI